MAEASAQVRAHARIGPRPSEDATHGREGEQMVQADPKSTKAKIIRQARAGLTPSAVKSPMTALSFVDKNHSQDTQTKHQKRLRCALCSRFYHQITP